jgi:glycosyltransferase involved in cell wall biosynthesis
MVDPRDDHALAGAMRVLLTNDAEVDRLSEEALRRPVRTWDTYAAQAWDVLMS